MDDNVSTIMEQQRISTTSVRTNDDILDLRRKPRLNEQIIQRILWMCGVLSIFTTIGIIVVLGTESFKFFADERVSLWAFLTSTEWSPQIGKFGILPLLLSTLLTSFVAMLVALPLGLVFECQVPISKY